MKPTLILIGKSMRETERLPSCYINIENCMMNNSGRILQNTAQTEKG
jgi:hypothetical protein